jgi:FKBP-type peptidyl-prolyl cis-trans isomerase
MNKFNIYLFLIITLLLSCNKDDNDVEIEIRDYSEQVVTDEQSIEDYLKSHFYNYEDFNSSNSFEVDIKVKIDTITDATANKTPLFDQVKIKTVNVSDSDGVETPHNLYYIIAREGVVSNPSVVDSVYITYKGMLTDNHIFDERKYPVWLDLANSLQGFRQGVSELKSGEFRQNSNGTIQYSSFGVGLFFLPSGIGYFENTTADIPEYSPLIFSVSLMTSNPTDHDNDGLLSINEDIDGDGDPFYDDTDNDNLWNMYDADDDGDGTLTINELDKNNDQIIDDTDNDGIPDYLDPDN